LPIQGRINLNICLKNKKGEGMIKNVLIKASGDVTGNEEFIHFAAKKAKNNYVVVICGGGTQINAAFEKAGFKIIFDNHGRVTETWEERKLARDILEIEEKKLQDKFIGTGVTVKAPILDAGGVICPVNGDRQVKAYYLGFEEIYVFTLKERIENKKKFFDGFPKVEIIAL